MDNRGVPDFNKKPSDAEHARSEQPRLSTGQSGKHLDASQNYKSTDEIDLGFIDGYEIGDTIGGTYFITSHLGRGGMGQVFGVEHIMLRQAYALKILTTDSPDNTSWRRFQTEARTIAKLNHPNIIKVHNLGIHNQTTPFYVMELLSGETLSSWIKREGALAPAAVIDLFLPLCDGLAYAHSHGIVHRDIKPSNIMLVSQNNKVVPKLVDFGLVKLVGSALSPSQQLTNTGEVFGSPLYMSPEQSVGRHINERSDIYSLGCTMFEALTGAPPFVGENVVQTILKHQNEAPPTLKQASMGGEFSPEWEAVIARALEKEASNRHQTMQELARDLQAIKDGKKLRKKFATDGGDLFDLEDAEEEAEKKKAVSQGHLLVAGSVLVLILLGVGATGYFLMQKQNAAVPPTHVDTLNYGGIQSEKQAPATVAENRELEDISVPFLKDDGQPNGIKTFVFPTSVSLGNLFIEQPGKERLTVECMGTKTAPVAGLTTFEADKICGVHPKIYRKFSKGDIQAVILPPAATDTDDELHFLNHLTEIGILNVDGSDITAAGLKVVDEMPKLTNLSAANLKKLSGKDLAESKILPRLQNLNFNGGSDVGPLIEALKNSKNMTDLSLNNCRLTAADIKTLASIKNLTRISLNDCNLTTEDIKPLATMPTLTTMVLRGNNFTPDLIDLFKDRPFAWLQITKPNWSEEDIARFKSTFGQRGSIKEV